MAESLSVTITVQRKKQRCDKKTLLKNVAERLTSNDGTEQNTHGEKMILQS
jgi:hypothetical protein